MRSSRIWRVHGDSRSVFRVSKNVSRKHSASIFECSCLTPRPTANCVRRQLITTGVINRKARLFYFLTRGSITITYVKTNKLTAPVAQLAVLCDRLIRVSSSGQRTQRMCAPNHVRKDTSITLSQKFGVDAERRLQVVDEDQWC